MGSDQASPVLVAQYLLDTVMISYQDQDQNNIMVTTNTTDKTSRKRYRRVDENAGHHRGC
jgi:hypothetical protein